MRIIFLNMFDVLRKRISNPVLYQVVAVSISLTLMVLLTLLVYFANIPNPNMILIAGLVIVTSLFGLVSGILSGLEMILYSMFFFSTDHSFFVFNQTNLYKLIVIIIGVVICVAFIGNLELRRERIAKELKEKNEELAKDVNELERLSKHDALTGALNRFAYKENKQNFVGKDLAAILVDLDDFKSINDDFGHEVGDKALLFLSDCMKKAFGFENVYRYGGDEFVAMFEYTSVEDIENRLKEMKQLFSISQDGQIATKLNFSAGYVYGKPETVDDIRLMLSATDKLLYKAKESGKNCSLGQAFGK